MAPQPSAEQIAKLREEVIAENGGQSAVDANFELDDACCSRYLRARNLDHAKAKAMLLETIRWRREFGVARMVEERFETLEFECTPGKFFISPFFDKEGRPIMIMRNRLENSTDHDGNILNLVYQLERGCAAAKAAGVEKWTLVIDFVGYSVRNAPPIKTSRATLSIMQDHYPERLHRAFLLDAPWLFSGVWSAISPFIDPVTHSKIVFVSGEMGEGTERTKLLEETFALSSLEECVGGTAKWTYSVEEYLREDRARYEASRAAQPAKTVSSGSEKATTAAVVGA